MRRVRHSAASLSISLLPFAISLCAAAALALPPNAEAAIHLGSTNTVSLPTVSSATGLSMAR